MTAEQAAALLDVEAFLLSGKVARSLVVRPGEPGLFAQGDAAGSVFYIQEGTVKLSVLAKTGKEAVVAMFGPGDFVGEGALTGQATRMASATAILPTRVLEIPVEDMLSLLHGHSEFSDVFIAYTLARNIRVEADLVDQLFNRSEKRLGAGAPAAGALRHAGGHAPRSPQGLAGNARRDCRHDPLARELLHEQVQEARVHRVQRRHQGPRLAAHRRPSRLTPTLSPAPAAVQSGTDGPWPRQYTCVMALGVSPAPVARARPGHGRRRLVSALGDLAGLATIAFAFPLVILAIGIPVALLIRLAMWLGSAL